MRRFLIATFVMVFSSACVFAAEEHDSDSLKPKQTFWQKVKRQIRGFSWVDTTYIEPQHYNFAFMLQNTNTIERYTLSSKDGQSISFAPKTSYKVGPYFGWRWIFLGYTLDVNHLEFGSHDHTTKKEFDLSLYSNQLGIDLFYRRTGNDYQIRKMTLSSNEQIREVRDLSFSGIEVGITGFNLYYIFNHKRFSYPAAYSQSTVQRRSCGSALVGVGYTRHSLNVDCSKLNSFVEEVTRHQVSLDSSLYFNKVKYTDISVSGGYAYNWVFARNWLFDASLSLAIGYKHSHGDVEHNLSLFDGFSFHNFIPDGVGRFGIVWNDTKWYAGANAIFHAYNYNKSQFSTNNMFGSVNFYVGFNFDRR